MSNWIPNIEGSERPVVGDTVVVMYRNGEEEVIAVSSLNAWEICGDDFDIIAHKKHGALGKLDITPGQKLDGDKPLMHLIPARAEMALARVLTFGARKYSPENWRLVDNQEERYMAATMRHMNAHRQGELRDSESGELHLAHALTCLSFLVDALEASNDE